MTQDALDLEHVWLVSFGTCARIVRAPDERRARSRWLALVTGANEGPDPDPTFVGLNVARFGRVCIGPEELHVRPATNADLVAFDEYGERGRLTG